MCARFQGPWGQRFRDVLLPALLGPLQLCLFGPFTIYQTNQAEFAVPFPVLLVRLLPPLLLLSSVLILIGVLLSARWFRPYVSLLFGIGILLWIQGNLLAANYLLNGDAVDWSAQDWRNPGEAALWIGVPVLALTASRFLFPITTFGSGVLAGLQTILLLTAVARGGAQPQTQWQGPSEGMFEVSARRNVFHILLDGFHSDVFQEFLGKERAALDRSFSGFVFFADHAGAFPTTIVSVPAMLTGHAYRNDTPLPTYRQDHFKKGSLFASLRAGGYRVDSLSEMDYDSPSATTFYRIPRPYVSYQAYSAFAAWQLADLSLFRHVPHRIRPWFFNNYEWRLQNWFGRGYASESVSRRHHPVNGAAVLAEFTRQLRATTDEPVYKFLHVGIPHQPAAMNGRCEFTGPVAFRRESYAPQARCAVLRVQEFLERLRGMGLYDSSVVVITSDHGMRLPPLGFSSDRVIPGGDLPTLVGRASALLLVKAPNGNGPLRVSRAPTAITDVPATILDAAGVAHGLPGVSALKLDANAKRQRSFAMYSWERDDWAQEYFDYLDVFTIDGPLHDGRSWRLAESIYRPNPDDTLRTRGLQEPHRSSSGTVYRWTDPDAFLHAPPDATAVEFAVRTIAPSPQTLTIRIDGRELERIILMDHGWKKLRYTLPPTGEPQGSWLSLSVNPPWRPRRGTRWLGVQLTDLKWYTTHPPDAR